MTTLGNFLYFEQSKIGVNLEEVNEFRIEPFKQSDGETVKALIFYKKSGERTVISNRYDIHSFEQDHL